MPTDDYGPSRLAAVTVTPGNEDAAWKTVSQHCADTLTEWGIGLLRKGLDGHVGTILVEPHYICKDYRNLYSNFYSKKFVNRASSCSRLHFFSEQNITVYQAIMQSEGLEDNYIGYAVVEPIEERCIGRMVVDPYKIGFAEDSFHCLRTEYVTRINGVRYSVRGFPYRSQSGEATVCAHAALWSCCRHLSERYTAYGEVYPYDLIEMTGDTEGRRTPYRGMSYGDYSSILSKFGCYPETVRPKGNLWFDQQKDCWEADWRKDREAFFDFYNYVESGFPVLTSFGGHVVNIIGHTSKVSISAAETPERHGFFNSSALVERYIVADDNHFPYQELGYKGDTSNYGEIYASANFVHIPSIDSIFAGVVPLPEKAYLQPKSARKFCYDWYNTPGSRSQIEVVQKEFGWPDDERLVARTFLTSGPAFKKRKKLMATDDQGKWVDRFSMYPVDIKLPHFVWVMELSPLHLHNQGYCIGEIVLDGSVSYQECKPIYARIGRVLFREGQQQWGKGEVLGEFPQYTHNLGERN